MVLPIRLEGLNRKIPAKDTSAPTIRPVHPAHLCEPNKLTVWPLNRSQSGWCPETPCPSTRSPLLKENDDGETPATIPNAQIMANNIRGSEYDAFTVLDVRMIKVITMRLISASNT
jgi:hypothetical protein